MTGTERDEAVAAVLIITRQTHSALHSSPFQVSMSLGTIDDNTFLIEKDVVGADGIVRKQTCRVTVQHVASEFILNGHDAGEL